MSLCYDVLVSFLDTVLIFDLRFKYVNKPLRVFVQ